MPAPGSASDAKEARGALRDIRLLRSAVATHRAATGELPTSSAHIGVVARMYAPGVPVRGGMPVDPWGKPLVYQPSETAPAGYVLYSAGPNGRDEAGAGDDLGAGRSLQEHRGLRFARQLLPIGMLVVVGPIGWAAIRAARRSLA